MCWLLYGSHRYVGRIVCSIDNEKRCINLSDIYCYKISKGYGSAMMIALISYARSNNYTTIDGWLSRVDYGHKERLYHFYKKFGFEISPNDTKMKFADMKLLLDWEKRR